MHRPLKMDAQFIIKASLVFCALSAAFSFGGMFMPERVPLANPAGGLNLHEIGGHLIWGLLPGALFLSARYAVATGFFAVLIDSDHMIALFRLDALPRMSHSIAFAAISIVVLMLIFGRKDYRLGAAALAAVLAHISFDTFAGNDGKFPLLVPFYGHAISFPNADWIFFEAAAAAVILAVTVMVRRQSRKLLAV